MTYGCETWDINEKTRKRINGTNSVTMVRISGKSIPQETRPTTTSLDLIRRIRMCRHRWVGHILRLGQEVNHYIPGIESLVSDEG